MLLLRSCAHSARWRPCAVVTHTGDTRDPAPMVSTCLERRSRVRYRAFAKVRHIDSMRLRPSAQLATVAVNRTDLFS